MVNMKPRLIAVKPFNVTITPFQSIYQLGDVLTCAAVGRPPPTFRWIDLDSGTVFDGPELKLFAGESFDAARQFAFRCSASNSADEGRESTSKDINFIVNHTYTPGKYYDLNELKIPLPATLTYMTYMTYMIKTHHMPSHIILC